MSHEPVSQISGGFVVPELDPELELDELLPLDPDPDELPLEELLPEELVEDRVASDVAITMVLFAKVTEEPPIN